MFTPAHSSIGRVIVCRFIFDVIRGVARVIVSDGIHGIPGDYKDAGLMTRVCTRVLIGSAMRALLMPFL